MASAADSRIKVNALRALGRFDYASVKDLLLKTTAHKEASLAITASEFFLSDRGKEAKPADYKTFFETAKQLTHWRSRSNMLTATLKWAPEKEKKERKRISDWISAAMKKSANTYEKAWLLQAMAWDIDNVGFIQSRTFANAGKHTIISTNGISALTGLFGRAKEAKKIDQKQQKEFMQLFIRAVQSGDSSMITAVADLLRNPKMKFKVHLKNFAFLNTALEKCRLPEQLEAYESLKKTIHYLTGNEKATSAAPKMNRAVDWDLVSTIATDKRIKIKTGMGDIVVQLNVNDSPGSVSNFVRLIRENFFKSSVFHRVVPNFVIQDGCPRGDGWGGPPHVIGSELGYSVYKEGTLGMASAGKDTEGSQWFITHSPTPHLDGRYTVFGRVVSGMEVVHRIEVGDRVSGFEEL